MESYMQSSIKSSIKIAEQTELEYKHIMKKRYIMVSILTLSGLLSIIGFSTFTVAIFRDDTSIIVANIAFGIFVGICIRRLGLYLWDLIENSHKSRKASEDKE